MKIHGYQLPLVKSTEYQKHSKGRLPYPHQARVLEEWDEHEAIFLTTRTGSGKTATAAFPLFVKGESAVFVYPTNALLEDQAVSIARIGEGMGRRLLILDGSEPVGADRIGNADHIIVVLNGETLEQFRGNVFHVKNKGRAITELLAIQKPMMILTNPDVLFLLTGLRYADAGKSLGFLQNAVFSTLVVDEFHLYGGLELAHLLFLLHYMREIGVFHRLVLLSATPSEQTKQYVDRLFAPTTVTADPAGREVVSFREVVHSLDLEPKLTEDVVEVMFSEVEAIQDELLQYPLSDSKTPVPLVIIVNSVIQAMRLEEALVQRLNIPVGEIAPYRGLVNQKERSLEGKRIVLGTSAIEVGVDFDCELLFFEASNAAAFLQRIGRAGRHRPGRAMLFGTSRICQSLRQLSELERPELESWVKESYPHGDDMEWFIASREGMLSAYALLYRGISEIQGVWYLTADQIEDAVGRLEEIFKAYIGYFEPWLSRGDVLTLSKKGSALREKWFETYVESHSFRASNYSVDVHSRREKWLGRESDAGYFTADLKRVLEQGVRPEFRPKSEQGKGHLFATVETFGKKKKTFASVQATNCKIGIAGDLSFQNESGDRVSSHYLGAPIVYVTVPKREMIEHIDWRIETWDLDKDGLLAAFGGHALLLKALYDKVQRRKTSTSSMMGVRG